MSDTNFIFFPMCRSHWGVTASLLKMPVCNLRFILEGLYKRTCLHICWQYWSKKRLNYLFTGGGKSFHACAKNRSSDFHSLYLTNIKSNFSVNAIISNYYVSACNYKLLERCTVYFIICNSKSKNLSGVFTQQWC